MTQQITLIGFLGATPQILDTKERTVERVFYNSLADDEVPQDVVIPSRRFARISLATGHDRSGKPQWHNLVAWNLDQGRDRYGVLIASKGDKVKVVAHEEVRTFTAADGTERQAADLVVDQLTFIRKKARREWP